MKLSAKIVLRSLLVILIIIQFIHPAKNISDDKTNDITTQYAVPENVNILLAKACNDCHSNKTNYPWYSYVQPIDWWITDHVNDGKRHLNFSEFTKSNLARQNHKLEEVIETIKEREMPLPSYTWLGMHPEADLTDDEKNVIITWAGAQMDSLKKKWPADSLVRKPRQ
jgi:hypothetical protein